MYGVLPGGEFDGAPLTPPRGGVKSTPGNHQLVPADIPIINIEWNLYKATM